MPRLLNPTHWCCTLVVLISLHATSAVAQSETKEPIANGSGAKSVASPALQTGVSAVKPTSLNPFMPAIDRGVRLPIALEGYSAVAIREKQQWIVGSNLHQLLFDGQVYLFANEQEQAIFAGNPMRYVPTLGGDCIVTYADTGARRRGVVKSGILHRQRLFFFCGQAELEKFRSAPEQYANADLFNQGYCLVSTTDHNRQMVGLPETTIMVGGLRYRFAGQHEQQLFLSNIKHYGVTPPKLDASSSQYESNDMVSLNNSVSETAPAKGNLNQETQIESKPIAEEIANKAMGGYCPVSIHTKAMWTLGEPKYKVEFDGLTYLLAGEEERELFRRDPNAYVPAFGGNCVVSQKDTNRRIDGSIYHAVIHADLQRLYLFASAEQKLVFEGNPDNYLQVDLVAEGNCVVTLVDEGRVVRGSEDLMHWHRGKRYYFASEENRKKFLQDVERYQD